MSDYCHKCKRVTESRAISHPSGVEFVCAECGWQVDFMFDESAFEDDDEPVDSCEACGGNIYECEDDGSGLCDQCSWYRHMSAGSDTEGWEMVG